MEETRFRSSTLDQLTKALWGASLELGVDNRKLPCAPAWKRLSGKVRSVHRVGNLAKQGGAAVFRILRLSIVKRVNRRKRKGK